MKRLLAVVLMAASFGVFALFAAQGAVGAQQPPAESVKPVEPVDVTDLDHSHHDVGNGEEQLPCYGVGVDLSTGKEFTERTPCDYVISLKEAEAAQPR